MTTRAPRRLPGLSPALRAFLPIESGGAILLLAATVLALVWANSPWSAAYENVWSTTASLGIGDAALEFDLRHWVNEAAMTIFFLVVGLEITRELTVGEMRDSRSIAAPAFGAVAGMIVPAIIYLMFNPAGEAMRGWGIAMSTDTAFVVGVLALLGSRVPDRLRMFLPAWQSWTTSVPSR